MPPGQNKTTIYAPRVHGDLDLGRAPNRINNDGDQELARMIFPGTLLPGQTAAEIYTSGTTQKYPIGTRLVIDERVFRYALVGGTDAMGGRAVANLSTNEQSTAAPATYAVGVSTVTITAAAGEDLAANALAGGYLCYRATRYYQHRIISNTAATAGNTSTLVLETALVVEGITATSTTLCAYASPWAKVGYGGSGGSNSFVGFPYGDISTGEYTWVQTWGPVNMCPGAFYGDDPNQRQCVFTSDGALAIFAAGSWTGPYQEAGFVMPMTYWGGARHAMSDGGHLIFLQICP